jgi:hypothetical protein
MGALTGIYGWTLIVLEVQLKMVGVQPLALVEGGEGLITPTISKTIYQELRP